MNQPKANSEFPDAPMPAWADPAPPDWKRRPPDRHMCLRPKQNLFTKALLMLHATLLATRACDVWWSYNTVNINYPYETYSSNFLYDYDGVANGLSLYGTDGCVQITFCGYGSGFNVCIDILCQPFSNLVYVDFDYYDDFYPCSFSTGFYISLQSVATCGYDTTPLLLWSGANVGSVQMSGC